METIKIKILSLSKNQASDEIKSIAEDAFFNKTYRVLYILGFSPWEHSVKYTMYTYFVRFLLLLMVCSEFYFLASETESMDRIIDNASVTIIQLTAAFRFYAVIYKYRSLIKDIIKTNVDVSSNSRQAIFNFWSGKSNFIWNAMLAVGSCTLWTWHILPLIDDKEYNFQVNVRLPYNHSTKDLYPPSFGLVTVSFHYAANFVMVNDLMMCSIILFVVCQFNLLKDCYENILTESKGEHGRKHNYKSLLKKYTEQHQSLLENTQILKNLLSAPMVIQLGGSTLLTCFVAYNLAVGGSPMKLLLMLQYFGYTMMELFVICWCSNELTIQTVALADGVYAAKWEETDVDWGAHSDLHLIMLRSQRPVTFTAGGIYDLSLSSYLKLMKLSYSALTLLLRVKD